MFLVSLLLLLLLLLLRRVKGLLILWLRKKGGLLLAGRSESLNRCCKFVDANGLGLEQNHAVIVAVTLMYPGVSKTLMVDDLHIMIVAQVVIIAFIIGVHVHIHGVRRPVIAGENLKRKTVPRRGDDTVDTLLIADIYNGTVLLAPCW